MVAQPLPLHSRELKARDGRRLSAATQMVEKRTDGHEPARFPSQAAQQFRRTRMDLPLAGKAAGKMRIHDANATFFFEPVLVAFVEQLAEALDIRAVATAEPGIHKWPPRIVIWHAGVDAIKVDVAKNEITNIRDTVAANVAPEIRLATIDP